MINPQINHSIETMEIDLKMDIQITRMQTGETLEIFLVLHRLKGEISQNYSYRQPGSDQPNNSAFGRSDNRSTTGFKSYEQRLPQKLITRRHPMWSALLQLTITFLNYQTSVR